MHPIAVHEEVRRLVGEGLPDGDIAAAMGLPRTTVRDIRAPRRTRRSSAVRCFRCWEWTRPIRYEPPDYAELLGLYLGDGCISRSGRVFRLRIKLDARYPTIVAETIDLFGRVFPANRVGRVETDRGSAVEVGIYSRHVPCLLPQHGAGPKHRRPIVLEEWQRRLVHTAPWQFLRGCIRSDGCVFVNRTGSYRYLSYDFCNSSEDIRRLFVETCDAVGVETRCAGNRVRINRRASVAQLREHVGLKS